VLGSTFGGNGVTTFGVPDERARARIAVDLSVSGATSGRITATTGGAGVLGNVLGTSGGSQFIQSHAHTASVTDAGHTHEIKVVTNQAAVPGAGSGSGLSGSNLATSGGSVSLGTTNIGTASLSATINATGAGSSGNMMPFIISFLPLIKT
jgi:microcystin-dependent protein